MSSVADLPAVPTSHEQFYFSPGNNGKDLLDACVTEGELDMDVTDDTVGERARIHLSKTATVAFYRWLGSQIEEYL